MTASRSLCCTVNAIGQHAIPNREALDKILRYETTIDRNSLVLSIDSNAYSVAARRSGSASRESASVAMKRRQLDELNECMVAAALD
jgi:hypothetical protein